MRATILVIWVLTVILGLFFGLYVGVWWGLIGGIVQGVEACKATPIDSWELAFGAARVFLCSAAGWTAAWLTWIGGSCLVAVLEFRWR